MDLLQQQMGEMEVVADLDSLGSQRRRAAGCVTRKNWVFNQSIRFIS